MATGEDTMAAFEGNRQAFEQILTKALRGKGNILILAKCATQLKLNTVERRAHELIIEQGIVTDIDRGRALWGLLQEAIERLRPATSEPDLTPAWRLYVIATGIYIQGKSVKTVTAELGLSLRTFHRERRAVVEALVTVVWQIERQTCRINEER